MKTLPIQQIIEKVKQLCKKKKKQGGMQKGKRPVNLALKKTSVEATLERIKENTGRKEQRHRAPTYIRAHTTDHVQCVLIYQYLWKGTQRIGNSGCLWERTLGGFFVLNFVP